MTITWSRDNIGRPLSKMRLGIFNSPLDKDLDQTIFWGVLFLHFVFAIINQSYSRVHMFKLCPWSTVWIGRHADQTPLVTRLFSTHFRKIPI